MKFFSFASGVDLFGLGMRQAGHEQVGHAEVDKWSNWLAEEFALIDNYSKKLRSKNHGDIRKIAENPSILPDFDIACAGLPCPAFSIAGKRKDDPFNQTKCGGDLFIHFCKIIQVKKPRILFLEQVKGVLSSGKWKGEIFSSMLNRLSELGYDAEWQTLNSKNFGVPQNRERVFVIGYLRNKSRPKVFPLMGETNENSCKSESAKTAVARTISGGGHTGGNHSGMTILQLNKPKHSNDRVYSDKGISPTINSCSGGNRQPFVLTEIRSDEAKKIRREHKEKTGKDFSPRRGKVIVPKKEAIVGTLTTRKSIEQSIFDGKVLRRLTPLEFFRLQGAPDALYEKGRELGISDSQLFKMAGNSVTLPVIKAIGERLWIDGS